MLQLTGRRRAKAQIDTNVLLPRTSLHEDCAVSELQRLRLSRPACNQHWPFRRNSQLLAEAATWYRFVWRKVLEQHARLAGPINKNWLNGSKKRGMQRSYRHTVWRQVRSDRIRIWLGRRARAGQADRGGPLLRRHDGHRHVWVRRTNKGHGHAGPLAMDNNRENRQ